MGKVFISSVEELMLLGGREGGFIAPSALGWVFLALLTPRLVFGHGLGFPSLRVFVPGSAWQHHLPLRHPRGF